MSVIEPLPRFACPDWWEKIQAGEVPIADVPVNEKKAAKVLAFFNRLRLPDIPGNPPLSEACGDWFKAILVVFFASEDPETHREIVWELLCLVPKKNSKSTYVAALALTALYMEEAPNRQMLLVGPSQNISERLFSQAQSMIDLDEKLRQIFQVQDHLKTITRRKTKTALDVKTFDTSIVTGEIPVLTIIDELHELGKKAKAAKVMQQIRGGGITKVRGKVLMITTQSDEMPTGVWKSELQKARAIRDGKGGRSPILLPVLYEFPEELQRDEAYWRDQRNWSLVLPNIGLSIDEEALIDDYENNGKANPEAEQIWASQHLNIEIGVGLGGDAWSGAPHWDGAAIPGMTLDELLAQCEVCTIGVDWGGADDLAALAVIGRRTRDKAWLIWGKAWARKTVFEQRPKIADALRGFQEDGDLAVVETPEQQAAEAAEICLKVSLAGKLPEQSGIGLDVAGVALLQDALEELELVYPVVQSVGQGWKLQMAISTVALKLESRRILHADQPIMAWAVGNAKQVLKGSTYLVTKQASGAAKIDPLMAIFDAAMLMFLNPVASQKNLDDFLSNPVLVV
ncbi:terminase large subunit [Thioclava sp. GXIMD2076]|uniref:terminase large subunit domain-containing protein n=1 Tax=Thioclava sp. GXIMD2076 TaxID=3131931 RepID=UPI0030CBE6E1